MEWATKNNSKIKAFPGIEANCPLCNGEVIPKCGSIKVWHWAHKIGDDCDSWSEPESQWHKDWKNEFPIECQEVIIKGLDWDEENDKMIFVKHRADIKFEEKIIELQNSPISSEEIKKREGFYDNMIWLVNGKELFAGLELRKKDDYYTFRLKNPPKSWFSATKRIYIHLNGYMARSREMIYDDNFNGYMETVYNQSWDGSKIFVLKKIYPNVPCGGYGVIISKEEFIRRIKDGTI